MSERILAFLVQFITHVIDAGGYAGIVALLAINSACIPLPSELIMPFSGYLVYLGRFNLILVALAGAGCSEVSLTVTESNELALRLYRHMGFHAIHRFKAFIWDKL